NVEISVDPGYSNTLNFMQSEVSFARALHLNGSKVLWAGFNDFTDDVAGSPPAFTNPFKLMGLAWSNDDGATWNHFRQFQAPAGSGYNSSGDPWMAVDRQNFHTIWYVNMAETYDKLHQALIYTKTTDGGSTWPQTAFAQSLACGFVDKPSIDVDTAGTT